VTVASAAGTARHLDLRGLAPEVRGGDHA